MDLVKALCLGSHLTDAPLLARTSDCVWAKPRHKSTTSRQRRAGTVVAAAVVCSTVSSLNMFSNGIQLYIAFRITRRANRWPDAWKLPHSNLKSVLFRIHEKRSRVPRLCFTSSVLLVTNVCTPNDCHSGCKHLSPMIVCAAWRRPNNNWPSCVEEAAQDMHAPSIS